VTLELCRHHPECPPQAIHVAATDGGWQLTFVLSDTGEQHGVVSAPIDGET